MAELEFTFDEFVSELKAIGRIADPFIHTESKHILPQLIDDLRNIQAADYDRPFSWQIPEDRPLKTITSRGQYEKATRLGREHVFAELTSIWEIARVRRKRREPERFVLKGKTSTMIRLRRDNPARVFQEIAMWRTEVGVASSPGCHFHIQILGEHSRKPYPKSLPIPRFPSIIATPMMVLEYVLSELFQDEWIKRASEGTSDMNVWYGIQSARFLRLLSWHSDAVRTKSGSPWIAIKSEKPASNLFLETPKK